MLRGKSRYRPAFSGFSSQGFTFSLTSLNPAIFDMPRRTEARKWEQKDSNLPTVVLQTSCAPGALTPVLRTGIEPARPRLKV